MDMNFWAAVVGAVLGGALAVGAQEFNHRRQVASAQADLRSAVMMKLILMQADHGAVLQLLKDGHAFAAAKGISLAQATKPAVNHPLPIEITPAELGAILQTRDTHLLDKMFTVAARHSTMIALGRQYSAVREKMTDISQGVPSGPDGLGRFALAGGHAQSYLRYLHEANQLLELAQNLSAEQLEEIYWMVDVLNAHSVRLGDSSFRFRRKVQPSTGHPSGPI